jgi:putative membrane protein
MMWHYPEGMGWWMIFGSIWMVIFWGGLIALIVWGVTKVSKQSTPSPKHDPLDIAKERYAKGEISQEEFKRLKQELS